MEATSPEGYMYYYNTKTGGEFRFTQDIPHLYQEVILHCKHQDSG